MDDMVVIMIMFLARFMVGEHLLNVVAEYPSQRFFSVMSASTENDRETELRLMGTVKCGVFHIISACGSSNGANCHEKTVVTVI